MSKILDSRDLLERREELEAQRDSFVLEIEGEQEGYEQERLQAWAEENPEDAAELAELVALCDECEGYGDWEYGETLIPEDKFTDHIREMLVDCGTVPKDLPWFVELDWDATAENCKADYMEVTFQGETYLMRT